MSSSSSSSSVLPFFLDPNTCPGDQELADLYRNVVSDVLLNTRKDKEKSEMFSNDDDHSFEEKLNRLKDVWQSRLAQISKPPSMAPPPHRLELFTIGSQTAPKRARSRKEKEDLALYKDANRKLQEAQQKRRLESLAPSSADALPVSSTLLSSIPLSSSSLSSSSSSSSSFSSSSSASSSSLSSFSSSSSSSSTSSSSACADDDWVEDTPVTTHQQSEKRGKKRTLAETESKSPIISSSSRSQADLEKEELGPEDDISEDEPPKTENVVLCQYEKVKHANNRFKCIFKDGLMRLNGVDYCFSKATAEVVDPNTSEIVS
eukprot:TRINITY_DN166_c2_g1_i3.p2 TRINITY_DN166_c2_g1~~TRINITY_DN166_c2_g1_i3.p2  ORF type:complete len:318 (+),score=112.12 TRINITY_DN166_c2_g1_i3:158-1111(+)